MFEAVGEDVRRIRANRAVEAFLTGARPAVIGAIAGSAIPLGLELAPTSPAVPRPGRDGREIGSWWQLWWQLVHEQDSRHVAKVLVEPCEMP
jgi:hypothetical protein